LRIVRGFQRAVYASVLPLFKFQYLRRTQPQTAQRQNRDAHEVAYVYTIADARSDPL
jgi:hypothetical protein